MKQSAAKILDCAMQECVYNKNNQCHTMAITVGDDICPMCDTFTDSSSMGEKRGGYANTIGSVGACKTHSCKFNESLECASPGIHIGQHADHGDCNTFIAK